MGTRLDQRCVLCGFAYGTVDVGDKEPRWIHPACDRRTAAEIAEFTKEMQERKAWEDYISKTRKKGRGK